MSESAACLQPETPTLSSFPRTAITTMPATRNPQKSISSVNFRSVKKSTSKKSPKKGKSVVKNTPVELPALDSDIESVSEDEDFEPLESPGGKLDESRYTAYHRSLKTKRGVAHPIHAEGQTKVNEILRIFDLSYEYGPCVGISRLDRWERAQKAGLNPPTQVKEILETKEGQTDDVLSQNVFYSEGI